MLAESVPSTNGHRWNGSDEGSINIALVVNETHKRADHGRQQTRRFGRSKLTCFVQDEIADLLSGQSLQVGSPLLQGLRSRKNL
jgi:hypothetical protein